MHKSLIDKGVNINALDNQAMRPLHYAAKKNSIGAAKVQHV